MASVLTKVEAFDMNVVLGDTGAKGGARSKLLAEFAREQLVVARDINYQATGRAVDYDTFVDGVEGAALERVSPNGKIVFDFHLGTEVVQFVYELIVKNSPVLKGVYARSHRIYADGVEVDTPADAAGADEVVILSVVPYARKIEGVGKRPPQSKQAPNGVYEVSAAMAQKRFGNIAKVRFGYREPLNGSPALETWARRNAAARKGSTMRKRVLKNLRQPAVIITFKA